MSSSTGKININNSAPSAQTYNASDWIINTAFLPNGEVAFASKDGATFLPSNESSACDVWSKTEQVSESLVPVNPWSTVTSDGCTPLREGHYRGVDCVVFIPNGRWVVSASADCTITLWSTKTNKPVHSLIGHRRKVTSIAPSSDGKWLVSGSDDCTMRLWSLTSPGWSRILCEVKSAITCVAFSLGEKYIVCGMNDGTIILSGKDGYIVRTLIGHDKKVNSLAFTPDGKFMISGSDGFNLIQWSIETGEYSYFNSSSYKPNWIKCAAFTPDGQLVSGSNDNTLLVWSREGNVVKTLTGHEGYVSCIAVSLDGKFLASGSSDRTIIIRSTETWEVLNTLKDVGVVTSVAFSPNGQFLVSGFEGSSCLDDTIKIWTIPTSVNE